jgi:hypothetical protein
MCAIASVAADGWDPIAVRWDHDVGPILGEVGTGQRPE